MYRIIFAFILTSAFLATKGQDTLITNTVKKNPQAAYYDSLTFNQYQNRDYKALIKTAKKAEQSGVTFQYLNYRKAIAYYELKNYAKAVKYYEKALYDVPDDLFLKESLYSAYLLSGLDVNASVFAKKLPKKSQEKLDFSSSFLNFISISGGYSFNNNDKKLRNNIEYIDSTNLYQDMIFGGAIFGLNISDRIKLNVGYDFFNTKFERFAQNKLKHSDFLSQHQLNLGMEFYLKNNFSLGFTGGFYAIEKNNKSIAPTSNNGHQRKQAIPPSQSTDYNISALVFLSKRFTYVTPEISFAYSDFASSNQLQSKLQLTFYPLGNLNFYGTISGTIILNNDKKKSQQIIFSQNLGVRLFKGMWLEGAISVGNHLNYMTERSFIVYDTYDPIQLISNLNLSYYFKKITLSATYLWSQREGWALTNYYMTLLKYKYNNQLVNISVKWNF